MLVRNKSILMLYYEQVLADITVQINLKIFGDYSTYFNFVMQSVIHALRGRLHEAGWPS